MYTMMVVLFALALLLLATLGQCGTTVENKIVCYYNSKSHLRPSLGEFNVGYLETALPFCTHLVYGYAAINASNNKLIPLDEEFDIVKDNYRKVTKLKQLYPRLKVLLSVGGNEDLADGKPDVQKYLNLIDSVEARLTFINSARALLQSYGFDGLDLAWQFPATKPVVIRGTVSNLIHQIKTKIVGESLQDDDPERRRDDFAALVRELRNNFLYEGLLVTVSVLPNVNSTVYFRPMEILKDVEHVTLMAFDYYTPKRNPKRGDFMAPLYRMENRRPDENIDFLRHYWTNGTAKINDSSPHLTFTRHKVILGIPTHGRAWELTSDPQNTGVPPVTVHKYAKEGPYTNQKGLLSYPEICVNILNVHRSPIIQKKSYVKQTDPSGGSFAYRLPDDDGGHGVWISMDDPDMAGAKATYSKAHGLGGVAIVDLTFDDFRGLCTGERYPILREVRKRLQ